MAGPVPTCDDRRCKRTDRLEGWARGLWCPDHVGAVIAGQARMAEVRLAVGLPLSPADEAALANAPKESV